MGIFIKNSQQIALMREASRIVAQTHELLARHLKPGITTGELNAIAEDFMRSKNAVPSFLGYNGYPASINVSINEEVIHGIPGLRKVKQGDIVSIDIGACFKGFHGDAARSHAVGAPEPEKARLLEVTKESFFRGIAFAKQGCHLYDICGAIQEHAESNGFTLVREFCGHGVGSKLHEDPEIPNYKPPGRGPRLQRGMTFAIEPMVNSGSREIEVLSDNWTVVTKDGKCSAHYENTILVTDGEPEILSLEG